MYIVYVNQKVPKVFLFFCNKKVDLSCNCVIIYVQLENRRSYMIKAIQITAMVKEDGVSVEYETAKHDSISLAEKDLFWMVEQLKHLANLKL